MYIIQIFSLGVEHPLYEYIYSHADGVSRGGSAAAIQAIERVEAADGITRAWPRCPIGIICIMRKRGRGGAWGVDSQVTHTTREVQMDAVVDRWGGRRRA